MKRVSKGKAIERLRLLADRARRREGQSTSHPEFKKWRADCEAALRNIFGQDSTQQAAFQDLSWTPPIMVGGDNSDIFQSAFEEGMESAVQMLEAAADEIADFWPEDEPALESGPAKRVADGRNVFIIHGRDLDFAEVVARFLEKRGLNAIILHEQANKGRTIIEKFEAHALPCAFAIALFTPDDEGRLRGSSDDVLPRARQNVVLETGYFCGAIGRDRVAIICGDGIKLPSDFDGLVTIRISSGAWRDPLGRELDAAGITGEMPHETGTK